MKDIGFRYRDRVHRSCRRQESGRAKIGRVIAENLTEDQAAALAQKVITFYREQGKFPEHQGATIDRIGFEMFVKAVS